MALLIGVPTETAPAEKRVATVPDVVEKLRKLGFSVAVQSGAGDASNFADDAYRAAGADIVETASDIWARSDIVFKVRAPSPDEVALLRQGFEVAIMPDAQLPADSALQSHALGQRTQRRRHPPQLAPAALPRIHHRLRGGP